uniref:CCHC-type domain-containing protein n=1 Tax=Photinus pyralis TaxID=7054 RepID=A0A1Y1JUZ4_PHOPY
MLKGKALLWYRNHKDGWRNWADVVDSVEIYFLPYRYRFKLEEDIRNRIQRPGEKAADYITDILTLIRRQGEMSRHSQLDRIYENLRTEYKHYIRPRDFNSLSDLLEFAGEFERLPKTVNPVSHNWGSPRVRFEARTAPNRLERSPDRVSGEATNTMRRKEDRSSYQRSEVCWNCGERGHQRRFCRGEFKPFCSRCGKEGILSKDCNCQRTGNEKRQ